MWENIIGRLPDKLILICSIFILTFLVPFVIYKINKKLHENSDPIWKKED
ncbi:hypothetical protein MUN88_00655 [Gracilibacillus caseinilyticus]|uniref:Uncharacterized protein n=1 Tax=Gracilibacillus caseinilyticus TaxID=2932256 RepID=A0ABY4EXX5_9BACI|nr:hypothetical protein [Gracilibacillus caseinilyticus]UOQ48707.1 hypothetical protein MUN88_00655 [Gracilibacillus caseinilyticus]